MGILLVFLWQYQPLKLNKKKCWENATCLCGAQTCRIFLSQYHNVVASGIRQTFNYFICPRSHYFHALLILQNLLRSRSHTTPTFKVYTVLFTATEHTF
jgi:hypothetical protein